MNGIHWAPSTNISKRTEVGNQDGAETQPSTLTILPLDATRRQAPEQWVRVRQRLGQFTSLSMGWNGENAREPNPHTVAFAAQQLLALQTRGFPAPNVNPSPDGAIFAEWHSQGINLELIFEKPYEIVALIEDINGELEPFEDSDPALVHTTAALTALINR